MKKAVVIGGSNGIGLALSAKLISDGYHVIIMDICKPEIEDCQFTYIPFDMFHLDEDKLLPYTKDLSVEILFITAGLGRVAAFENFCTFEIEKILSVNTLSTIKVIRLFYNKIRNEKNFYCGVVGSVAGVVSSPLFSVYAASKAAIYRFIESVNIELEMSGFKNRILDVVPLSVKGTKFNGGENDISQLSELSQNILDNMFESQELYLPQSELIHDIICQYQQDAHSYGMHSYQYKMSSGRIQEKSNIKVGYLSGTFDLFHVGHLNLLKKAKEYCDYLIVGVHKSGEWKGKETFIPFEERVSILEACKYVDKVVPSCAEDSDAWNLWKYDYLFVGSDYKGTERFKQYERFFSDKNVKIIYFPYTKGTSSTQIRNSITGKENTKNEK